MLKSWRFQLDRCVDHPIGPLVSMATANSLKFKLVKISEVTHSLTSSFSKHADIHAL